MKTKFLLFLYAGILTINCFAQDKPVIFVEANYSKDYGCVPWEPTDIPIFGVNDESCDADAVVTDITVIPATSVDGCTFAKSWTASYQSPCGQSADEITVAHVWMLNTKPTISVVANDTKDYGIMTSEPTDVPLFTVNDNCNENAIVTDIIAVPLLCIDKEDGSATYIKSWRASYMNACGQSAAEMTVTHTWHAAPSGVNDILSESKASKPVKAYNLLGIEVPLNTKGQIIIVEYEDGGREKIYAISSHD